MQAAVDAGVWTIMESFNEISGVPVVGALYSQLCDRYARLDKRLGQ